MITTWKGPRWDTVSHGLDHEFAVQATSGNEFEKASVIIVGTFYVRRRRWT